MLFPFLLLFPMSQTPFPPPTYFLPPPPDRSHGYFARRIASKMYITFLRCVGDTIYILKHVQQLKCIFFFACKEESAKETERKNDKKPHTHTTFFFFDSTIGRIGCVRACVCVAHREGKKR